MRIVVQHAMNIGTFYLLSTIFFVVAAVPSEAADSEIQRQLLERQQQQQELLLKQQQFEELLNPGLTPMQRRRIETMQFDQRQRQQELYQEQTKQFLQLQQAIKVEPPEKQKLKIEGQLQQFDREQQEQLQRFGEERKEGQRNIEDKRP